MNTANHPGPGSAPARSRLSTLVGWGLLMGMLSWAWQGSDMRPMALYNDAGNMRQFLTEFFPPDFADWRIYVQEMIVTVHIAIWGTALAVVCAIPGGLLCSANIAPPWVHQPVRRLMDAARAINEMVFAMLFIVAVGLGPAGREALKQAAEQAGTEMRGKARAEVDEAVAAMVKRGLQVATLTPAQKAEWRSFAEGIYPNIRGRLVPAETFDQVQRLLTEYRARHGG